RCTTTSSIVTGARTASLRCPAAEAPVESCKCSTGRGAAIRSSGTWAGTPSERSSP
ncbi:unnamed protein product, partial [Effrenium voratum]